jgi:hypothetical protein
MPAVDAAIDAATTELDAGAWDEPSVRFDLVAGYGGAGMRGVEDLDGDPSTQYARVPAILGLAYRAADNSMYVLGHSAISKYTFDDGNFRRLAGQFYPGGWDYVDGDPSVSRMGQPAGVVIVGDHLYFSDNGAFNVRRMHLDTHVMETVVGPRNGEGAEFADGQGEAPRFRFRDNSMTESNLATDGNFLYVADSDNHAIRRVDLGVLDAARSGEVLTIAGGPPPTRQSGYVDDVGTSARFNYPYSIAYEPGSNQLVVGDGCNRRTRRIQLPADPRSATYLDEVVVTTISGDGQARVLDGIGTAASHASCGMRAGGLIVDGNFLTAAGGFIREIDLTTTEVRTPIGPYPDVNDQGHRDGVGAEARLIGASGTFAYDGSHVYFPDWYVLRRYDPDTYEVETVFGPAPGWNTPTDGPLGVSRFSRFVRPIDVGNGELFMIEGSMGLRRLDLQTTELTTLSGPASPTRGFVDGAGDAARIGYQSHNLVQVGGAYLFVDHDNCAIRRVTPDLATPESSFTETVAGGPPPTADCQSVDGVGLDARFDNPFDMAVVDGVAYITEIEGRRIRALDLDTMEVTTLAGDGTDAVVDGVGNAASFQRPVAIAAGPDGVLYVGDGSGALIRRVDPATGEVQTVAGDALGLTTGHVDGIGDAARVQGLRTIQPALQGRLLYLVTADTIRTFDVDTHEVATLFDGRGQDAHFMSGPDGEFLTPLSFVTLLPRPDGSLLISQLSSYHLIRMTLP